MDYETKLTKLTKQAMARIQKRGLDYFPVNSDFIHDRSVRRLMKREGDIALAVLIEAFSYLYGGEGYYVCADRLFCEDISFGLFDTDVEDVERIIRSAVECGLFDSRLFEEHGVLTSADIQRQYLLCVRKRTAVRIEPAYCLLSEDELPGRKEEKTRETGAETEESAALMPQNVTLIAQSKEKKSKEKTPSLSPPEGAKEEERDDGEEKVGKGKKPEAKGGKEWTAERVEALQPPRDGRARNLSGLLENLRAYKVPPAEQYAIVRKSDYGAIGHEVWKGIARLRSCGGKIKLPGRYLLSVVNGGEVP